MKKLLTLLLAALFMVVLAACGNSEEESNDENNAENADSTETQENTEIVVGASSIPHAEILEEAKPLLEEQGITLKIEEYQDYVLPNEDLSNGTLDANYFQHEIYLNDQMEQFGYDFASLGGVHFEAMGIYSKSIESIEDIPEGTEVIVSRSIPDHGRILAMFEEQGLITLAEGVDITNATFDDIEKNPKDLTFSPDVDAAVLPEMYETEEDALVAINGNYALGAGLAPAKDALFLENENPSYLNRLVNLVVAKKEDADNEALKTLVDVLQSEDIQTFIEEEYKGAVVPAATEPAE